LSLTVSNSRLSLFLRCQYAHYLKYYKGLQKKTKAAALQRGTVVHEAIEKYNTGKSWKKVVRRFSKEFYANTLEEERVELGDLPKIVSSICDNYFACYENEDLEYLECEKHFELPLTKTVNLEGYIDAITKDSRGNTWPMEHKTYSRLPKRDFIMFNPQSARYIWALENMGYKPYGFLWNILLVGSTPLKPTMTEKTKKLSLAHINSTPFAIQQGIKELGLNPKDYQKFIDSFDYEGFFYRQKIRLDKNVVKDIMQDTIDVAIMIEKQGSSLKAKNLTKDCSWCSYKSICQAELMGLDAKFVIKNEYEEREHGRNENKKKEEPRKSKTHRHRR
jgi:RecB family exonuclease